MSEDRFPCAHADHPDCPQNDASGFGLIPCGVVWGVQASDAAARRAKAPHVLYRLILRLERLCHGLAQFIHRPDPERAPAAAEPQPPRIAPEPAGDTSPARL